MYKKWTICTLLMTCVGLCIIAAFIIYIDPFFDFHAPFSDYGYNIYNETYQNPGIARNFDYNAVILGSSMVQNCKPSEFDEQFNVHTVKLSYSGASFYNIKVISNIAFANNDIEIVFWGLDTARFGADPNEPRYPLPEYLYSQTRFDDVEYLLNKSVLIESIKTFKRQVAKKINVSRDDMYAWYPRLKQEFVSSTVARNYLDKRDDIISFENECPDNFSTNIQQNIIPMIEQHPETVFYIFFPPYSIMYWDSLKFQGILMDRISLKKSLIETLIQYDNVKLYDFQGDETIICNIDNYKDSTHYRPEINSYIVQAMARGEYLLTEDNFEEELAKQYDLIINIDVPELLKNYIE